jgi:hypothetical protein
MGVVRINAEASLRTKGGGKPPHSTLRDSCNAFLIPDPGKVLNGGCGPSCRAKRGICSLQIPSQKQIPRLEASGFGMAAPSALQAAFYFLI